jgi:hypothetical protein
LREFFASGPLRAQLVAAYPIGTRVADGPDGAVIPVCRSAEETGCLVTWRSYADGAPRRLEDRNEAEDRASVCVNPLTWRQDDAPAPASANLGSVPLVMLGGPDEPQPGRVGARCVDGVLRIEPPSGFGFWLVHADGNYHAYDYDLFYMNLRENAKHRVDAFVRGVTLHGVTSHDAAR